MVTQFHTLLHFVTLFCTISSLSASVAASIRIQGVSKSHLLSIYVCKRICYKPLQRGLCVQSILNPPVYGSPSSVNNQFHTFYMIFLYGPCC